MTCCSPLGKGAGALVFCLAEKKVLIVEDDQRQLESLKIHFAEIFNAEFANCSESAISNIKNSKFDLIVADYNLSGVNGLEIVRLAKSYQKKIKSIIITGYSSEKIVISALCMGVDYYFVKPFDYADLRIKSLEILSSLSDLDGCLYILTKREQQIAELLVSGVKPKGISSEFSISISTTRTHIRNIFKKLKINSKEELISNFGK